MSVADQMRETLIAELAPLRLEIADKSHLHAGHAGARPEGETHFHVTVVSEAFEGAPRVARHRIVNKVLAGFLADRVHALQLVTLTPSEDAKVS